jgi:hypothetical protein
MFALIGVAMFFRPPLPKPQENGEELVVHQPKSYLCYRAAKPLVIDGRLDDAAWQDAAWSDDFVDIEGDARPKPKHRTRMKMLWDDTYLYIAAELDEPHISASATKHDSYIFHFDHDFEVFIDPDGDNQLYVELEMNALNTIWDLLLVRPYLNGGPPLDSWENPGLKSAVYINGTLNDPRDIDQGWSIEIAWPWKCFEQLSRSPAPPKDGDQWRINFSRVELQQENVAGKYRKIPKSKEDNWVWSPQGAIDMHRPERWGYVQFSTQKPGSASFRADPSAAASELLHRLQRAQHAYRLKHGRYAETFAELGTPRWYHAELDNPDMTVLPGWYDIRVRARNARDSNPWQIRGDGCFVRPASVRQ